MSDEKISLADGSAGAAEKRREGIMKGPLAVSSCHCRYGKLEVPPEKKKGEHRGVSRKLLYLWCHEETEWNSERGGAICPAVQRGHMK